MTRFDVGWCARGMHEEGGRAGSCVRAVVESVFVELLVVVLAYIFWVGLFGDSFKVV